MCVKPELDADRVMVDGGSYGGYMVLASMIHFGDRLCCGVERFGISNFVTFLENTSAYRRDNVRYLFCLPQPQLYLLKKLREINTELSFGMTLAEGRVWRRKDTRDEKVPP